MLIAPESYIEKYEEKSYEEYIEERNRLIHLISCYEKNELSEFELSLGSPSPDNMYEHRLLYLSEICRLISSKHWKKRDKTLLYYYKDSSLEEE